MIQVTASSLAKLLKQVARMEDPITVMVWGPPGIGKSYTVEAVAKELGRILIPWSLGRKEKYDVVGIPGKKQIGNKEYTVWAAPEEWKSVFEAEGNAIVLFDEFTVAEENVQNAVLDIVLQKRVDLLELPKTTMFVLAGNEGGDDGTFATSITTALSGGRGIVCAMNPPSVLEWVDFQKPSSHITQFLMANQTHLYIGPNLSEPNAPWTCPRSWSQLDRIIRELELEEKPEEIIEWARGLLSPSTWVKFKDFIADNLISITKLIEGNKKEWQRYQKADPTRRSAVLTELAQSLMQQYGEKKENNFYITQKGEWDKAVQFVTSKLEETDEINELLLVWFQHISNADLSTLATIKYKGEAIGKLFDRIKRR